MPGELRAGEAGVRDQAHAGAAQAIVQGLGGMHDNRTARVANVAGQQTTTRDADAAERTRITGELERIKGETRADVDIILRDMEKEAGEMFDAGLGRAEKAYSDVFEEAKGGVGTWLTTWGDDWEKLIEDSLATAKTAYDEEVSRTIDAVATYVEGKIAEAKRRVARGKADVDQFVAGLDKSVAEFGREASASIAADFEAMTGEIDQRRDHLVDSLVQKFSESQARVSALEQKLREENKSLWQRIYDATVGVIEMIIRFKNMLLDVLARAAGVIGAIISDPIGFLGNLIDGVQAGLDQFVANIEAHLKEGLMGWLFGAMEGAGIQVPETFDLKGILSIVLQVLGLTYTNIRKRAVGLLGEETVSRLEQVAEIFKILVTEGPAGLWQMLMEKLGDIKDMILEQIRNWVIEEIIKAGILWLVSLLNPASAFIKACKAIYDIVMFFIERGKQILDLVNAILDTISAIASGNIQAMADKVEGALARMIPVAISFLASLLGLGGISEKIREIIETIQKPVNAAIDWVIGKAMALAKAAGSLLGGKKSKDKKEKEPDDPAKQAKVDAAMLDLDTAETAAAASGKEVTREEALAVAAGVQQRHPVIKGIRVVHGDGVWRYFYRASEEKEHDGPGHAQGDLPPGVIEEGGTKKMAPFDVVPFNFKVYKFGQRRDEYEKQLDEQQVGINKMSIAKWLGNRQAWADRKKATSDPVTGTGGSGRDPASNIYQQEQRAIEKQKLVSKWFEILKPQHPGLSDVGPDSVTTLAEAEADKEMKTLHALHGPDQIAGGDLEVVRLGDAGVNMSIGAQWPSRIGGLQNAVTALSLTKEQAPDIYMNVRLTLKDV
jgi:hypothetical protein